MSPNGAQARMCQGKPPCPPTLDPFSRQPEHRSKQAARYVRRSKLRPGVEFVQPSSHSGEQLVVELRYLVEQAAELAWADHEKVQRCCGADRRVAPVVRTVEQRQLTEIVARPQRRNLSAVPRNGRLAVDDDKELVPGLAFPYDIPTRGDVDLVRDT